MATIGFSAIAPRVVDENRGGSIPLVDRIQSLMQTKRPSIVALTGDGKTTGLRFVADYFADDIASGRLKLAIVDDEFLMGDFSQRSFVLTSSPVPKPQQTFTLATWGSDDFIQYLLANHPAQCASVMQRLDHCDVNFAGGSPCVWRHVLDAMATDTSVTDPHEVVAQQIECLLAEFAPKWSVKGLVDLLIGQETRGGLGAYVERELPREWEDCDLRWADLRGAAFQMGSTRCGLVGSPYPSHGTRTGFYTDTHEDLYYKQPELIRKASLVGCDL